MTTKITCQVCQHPNIEDNTCPNCETDLTLIRMLIELPAQDESALSPSAISPAYPRRKQALLFLLAGLILGIIGSFAFSTYSSSPPQLAARSTSMLPALDPSLTLIASSPSITPPEPGIEASPATCTGFRYIVRPGDSLTLIAWRLYGDADRWVRIAEVNPKVRDRGNALEIGEEVLVPNQEAVCP